jgi:glycosyltransferase involved in cell wall biosynthesis
MAENNKPLVTLAVVGYNQSPYVCEAIAGALAQDYSPLEIIVSDDCSTDDTFERMEKAVREYRGPHSVVLNRNPENQSIGAHISTVNRLAHGELVIAAAGDDVSVPDRVSRIVEAWLANNKQAGVLHSACRVIGVDGDVVEDLACPCLDALESAEATASSSAFVIGATEAWDKSIFDVFGDLRADLVHEDRALPFRSLLLGRTYPLHRPTAWCCIDKEIGVSSAYTGSGVQLSAFQRRIVLTTLRVDAQQRLDDLAKRPNRLLVDLVAAMALSATISHFRFEEGMPESAANGKVYPTSGTQPTSHALAIKRVVNRWRDG